MKKNLKSKIILILFAIAFIVRWFVLITHNIEEEANVVSNDLQVENSDDKDENSESAKSLSNTTIFSRYDKVIEDNSIYTKDLEARNNAIAEEYARGVKLFKSFANENSLNLTFIEPIGDRISRLEGGPFDVTVLLEKLYELGAETVHYFTDEEGLNIDLSIGNREAILHETMENIGVTYTEILYKASIENIDSDFKFETSKLNEFRNMLIDNDSLRYDLLQQYISKAVLGDYSNGAVYLNKIDENMYETIIVDRKNCYYKLVYNPRL